MNLDLSGFEIVLSCDIVFVVHLIILLSVCKQLSSILDEGFSDSIKIVLSVSFSLQSSLQISGISKSK